jgi:hypothetical protein
MLGLIVENKIRPCIGCMRAFLNIRAFEQSRLNKQLCLSTPARADQPSCCATGGRDWIQQGPAMKGHSRRQRSECLQKFWPVATNVPRRRRIPNPFDTLFSHGHNGIPGPRSCSLLPFGLFLSLNPTRRVAYLGSISTCVVILQP